MANAKRAENLLRNLIRINSENPPGNVKEISNFIEKEMKSIGMDVKMCRFGNYINLIGTLKGKKGKTLLLTPHMDTVPAGRGWKYNPFSAIKKNGKIYGRGSSDCKINVAACLEAARSIKESGKILNGNLVIAVTGDEETGSQNGLEKLIERGILKPDFAVVVDHESFSVIISQKGLMDIRVEIFGKKAHGAYPWLGDNAIEKASRIITELKEYKFSFKKHKLLREPTFNIGTIYGGEKVNIVADYCCFDIDFRYLPGMNPRKVLKDVDRIIHSNASGYRFTILDHQAPYEVPAGKESVQLLRSLRKYCKKSRFSGSEGAAPLAFFKKKNAVATGFGPENVAHMTNEFVYARDIVKGAAALEDFVLKYLGYSERKPKSRNKLCK